MRNRAKCKLCGDILESFHANDYVECSCKEISISGGTVQYDCFAKNWDNFIRIDDDGHEIAIQVKSAEEDLPAEQEKPPITKKEIYLMLVGLKDDIHNLPEAAMSLPITHYDFYSLLLLLTEYLQPEESD